jgi:two-component system, NarL family, nitrate/nitrite response regulator NarL
MTIRIVIADDHPVVLDGLVRLFSAEREFEVVASARNGDEALRALRKSEPDIIVLDLCMPGKDGIAVLGEMRRDGLRAKVVILTATESEDVLSAIRLGARGVVLKDMALRLLVECVRAVHSGGTWIGKSAASRVIDRMLQRESSVHMIAKNLTRREVEIARMVADGLPSKHVADKLAITEGTTKLHLHHIYSKLNVRGRVALVRYMQRHGLD